jgi:hypothetical protein
MIDIVDYEPVTGRLLVRSDGRIATYFSVPLEVFLGLRFARSPNDYFRRRVRKRFGAC